MSTLVLNVRFTAKRGHRLALFDSGGQELMRLGHIRTRLPLEDSR